MLLLLLAPGHTTQTLIYLPTTDLFCRTFKALLGPWDPDQQIFLFQPTICGISWYLHVFAMCKKVEMKYYERID